MIISYLKVGYNRVIVNKCPENLKFPPDTKSWTKWCFSIMMSSDEMKQRKRITRLVLNFV
jgi:hypothetical protein